MSNENKSDLAEQPLKFTPAKKEAEVLRPSFGDGRKLRIGKRPRKRDAAEFQQRRKTRNLRDRRLITKTEANTF